MSTWCLVPYFHNKLTNKFGNFILVKLIDSYYLTYKVTDTECVQVQYVAVLQKTIQNYQKNILDVFVGMWKQNVIKNLE